MREIKFRAWDTNNGGMILFEQIILEVRRLNKVIGWEIMQFTGLKDKNGKEIFEGDILRIGDHNTEVRFSEVRGAWYVYWDEDDYSRELYPEIKSMADVKVIGNIYENPELLNEYGEDSIQETEDEE